MNAIMSTIDEYSWVIDTHSWKIDWNTKVGGELKHIGFGECVNGLREQLFVALILEECAAQGKCLQMISINNRNIRASNIKKCSVLDLGFVRRARIELSSGEVSSFWYFPNHKAESFKQETKFGPVDPFLQILEQIKRRYCVTFAI